MARNPLSALQQKMREVERDNSRDRLAAFAICPAMSSADVDKPDVVNAHLTSCTNRATEKEEISVEEKRASAVAAAVRVGFGSGGGGTRNGRGGEVAHDGRYNGRRRVTESVPMDTSVSSDLAILVGGDDVVSVVAALEGLSTRRLSPSARLCDSAMKTLLKSRWIFLPSLLSCMVWSLCSTVRYFRWMMAGLVPRTVLHVMFIQLFVSFGRLETRRLKGMSTYLRDH